MSGIKNTSSHLVMEKKSADTIRTTGLIKIFYKKGKNMSVKCNRKLIKKESYL